MTKPTTTTIYNQNITAQYIKIKQKHQIRFIFRLRRTNRVEISSKERRMVKTGCCGSLIRLLLVVVNSIFLLIGIVVFVAAALLKWSPDSILKKITDNSDVQTFINVSTLDAVSIALLSLGAFIILLSMFGLLGACCANKFFLFLYEVVIIMLFVSHAIILGVGAIRSGDIESEFKNILNTTVAQLNTPDEPSDKLEASCNSLKVLSELFKCCAYSGPDDFRLNATYSTLCCASDEGSKQQGCASKVVSEIKSNGINIVVIPNLVILGVEFVIIILVPFLIGRIRRGHYSSNEEEHIINNNIKPTTFYPSYHYHQALYTNLILILIYIKNHVFFFLFI